MDPNNPNLRLGVIMLILGLGALALFDNKFIGAGLLLVAGQRLYFALVKSKEQL